MGKIKQMFMDCNRQVDQYKQDLINLVDSRVLFKHLSIVLFCSYCLWGFCVRPLFSFAVLCVISSFF